MTLKKHTNRRSGKSKLMHLRCLYKKILYHNQSSYFLIAKISMDPLLLKNKGSTTEKIAAKGR